MGGIGVCYGKWLPTQTDEFTRSHSFVVPQVHDSNECELVAIADAVLVALDEVKENITTLKANKWATRVMIWSDSHIALKYLQNPERFPSFGTGRPKDVRALIFRLVSEMNSFPINGPVHLYWIPGLCTPMHRLADYMTKNAMVKSGKADISRAMKMLFPKPTAGPRPAIEPAPQTVSDSKVVELDHRSTRGKDQIIGKETVKHAPEKIGPGSRNDLKRRASAKVEIDGGRPHKATRRRESIFDSSSGSGSSMQKSRSARIVPQSTNPQRASTQSLDDGASPTTSTAHTSNEREATLVAVDQKINEEKEELEEGEVLESRNEYHSRQGPVKESADQGGHRGRRKGLRASNRQATRRGNSAFGRHSSGEAVTSDKIVSSPKAAESSNPARDSVEDLQRLIPLDSFMPATIDRYTRRAKYPDFYSQLWDAIELLPRQQRSLMAMALEDQISVNIYPGWNASHGTMLSGIMANYRALYYPNIFSIVQRTALKLPEPMRDFMNDAIEKQHRRNCIRLG